MIPLAPSLPGLGWRDAPAATVAVAATVAGAFAAQVLGADLALDLARPDPLRALLCHAAHASPLQAVCTGGATTLLVLAVERARGAREALAAVLVGVVAVSAAALGLEQGFVTRYAGSSGVGHALAAVWALRVAPPAWRAPAAALLAAKVLLEVATGRVAFSAGLGPGWVALPTAHAAGAAAGALVAWARATAAPAAAARRPRG